MFKKTTLPNGLRIITVPQKSAEAVTVLVLVGTGSKYETKEINGISHFLEHMFFKGTKKRPSTTAIAETLDRVGGIYNAFTSDEYTGYFAKVAAPYFDLALDWVADIYLNSLLSQKHINKEKNVIIEEINMTYDNPMSYIGVLWNKLLYGNQPAGWHIAGSKQTVARLSRKKLVDYRNSQYTALNTVVCIAGRISPTEAVKKVKKYFSQAAQTPAKGKMPVAQKQSKPACLVQQRKTDQTHLLLGVRGYDIFAPQRYTQQVLATILGGMMSSRLFTEVREKLGIAYHISTSAHSSTDTGCLVTQAGVDSAQAEKAIFTILKEYKELTRHKVPGSELKKAKDCLKGKTALLLEATDARASFYGLQELLKKEVLTLKQIYAKIDRIGPSDILKVSQSLFQPRKLNLALIGPTSVIKNTKKLWNKAAAF